MLLPPVLRTCTKVGKKEHTRFCLHVCMDCYAEVVGSGNYTYSVLCVRKAAKHAWTRLLEQFQWLVLPPCLISSISHAMSSSDNKVSEAEVRKAQADWSRAITRISKIFLDGGDYIAAAGEAAGELYGYGYTNVLFKPTKAKDCQFRRWHPSFVVLRRLQCSGRRYSGRRRFRNQWWQRLVGGCVRQPPDQLERQRRHCNGKLLFHEHSGCSKTKVEYTFGYQKNSDGRVRIFLHHSSMPFSPASSAVTEADVQAVQTGWANAIKSISKTYLDALRKCKS